jgi:hypothetical protein
MTAPALQALPAVSGRHSNRVLASARKTRAVELKLQGLTYQQVADELGYANKGTVHRLVREALDAQQVQSVERLREVEVRRLDALQSGVWAAALSGDVDAVHACLRIIQERIKVLGLAEPSPRRGSRCKQPQTVILLEDDCRERGCPEHARTAVQSFGSGDG